MLRGVLAVLLLLLVLFAVVTRVREATRPRPEAAAAPVLPPVPPVSGPLEVPPGSVPPLDSLTRLTTRIRLNSETERHYLDSLVATTDSIVRHWPVGGEPIWFAIVPGGTPDFSPEMPREAQDAIDAWSPIALGLQLLETRDTTQATLTVRWAVSVRGERAGVTNVVWDRAGRIHRVNIVLATRDPGTGDPLPPEARRAVALHEMGHALGLPHSVRPEDAMHPITSALTPTDRDLTSLRLLYALPTGWIGGGAMPPPRRAP